MQEPIETDRLLLSAPKLSDAQVLFEFLGNKIAMQHTHCDANVEECRRRISVHEWRRCHDRFAPWTVRNKQTGEIIGWEGHYDDPFDPGWDIELAYYFAPAVWGNGYATELCRASLSFSDHRLSVENVSAFAHPGNVASNVLLVKRGFEFQRFVDEMQRNLYRRNRKTKCHSLQMRQCRLCG